MVVYICTFVIGHAFVDKGKLTSGTLLVAIASPSGTYCNTYVSCINNNNIFALLIINMFTFLIPYDNSKIDIIIIQIQRS